MISQSHSGIFWPNVDSYWTYGVLYLTQRSGVQWYQFAEGSCVKCSWLKISAMEIMLLTPNRHMWEPYGLWVIQCPFIFVPLIWVENFDDIFLTIYCLGWISNLTLSLVCWISKQRCRLFLAFIMYQHFLYLLLKSLHAGTVETLRLLS